MARPTCRGGRLLWYPESIGSSAIGSAIVKPCGIEGTYGRGGKHLNVGHDDKLVGTGHGAISRADVAAVMVEAVVQRSKDLRFVKSSVIISFLIIISIKVNLIIKK